MALSHSIRRIILIMMTAVVCGSGLLAILSSGRALAPGGCSPSLGGGIRGIISFFEGNSTEPPVNSEVQKLLDNPNFGASLQAVDDLKAGIVDRRLVATLQAITKKHQICIDVFKTGHYFLRGVKEDTTIPAGYGKDGGLLNTHYYGRAADIREVDGKPVRHNGTDPNILDVGKILADIPPQQRPDQTIGPKSWAEALGYSRQQGWILDSDQLELHEDHLHIGYLSADETSNKW